MSRDGRRRIVAIEGCAVRVRREAKSRSCGILAQQTERLFHFEKPDVFLIGRAMSGHQWSSSESPRRSSGGLFRPSGASRAQQFIPERLLPRVQFLVGIEPAVPESGPIRNTRHADGFPLPRPDFEFRVIPVLDAHGHSMGPPIPARQVKDGRRIRGFGGVNRGRGRYRNRDRFENTDIRPPHREKTAQGSAFRPRAGLGRMAR